jgi:hypothetical protein
MFSFHGAENSSHAHILLRATFAYIKKCILSISIKIKQTEVNQDTSKNVTFIRFILTSPARLYNNTMKIISNTHKHTHSRVDQRSIYPIISQMFLNCNGREMFGLVGYLEKL